MIKSLLIAVDSSAHASAAREHCVSLAEAYKAHLAGEKVTGRTFNAHRAMFKQMKRSKVGSALDDRR